MITADPIELTNIQAFTAQHLQDIKDIYLKKPSLMLEHYGLEKAVTEEYNGRQLLELIQNADDAAKAASDPRALIALHGDQLIIANTGEYFSIGGLESIFHSNLSPKYKEKKQIGNKGLGFRSILNWAHRVSIKSGELCIAFSKKNSLKVLKELIEEKPFIAQKIQERFGRPEPAISVLRIPEILTHLELPDFCSGFDTVIVINLKRNASEEIHKQLRQSVDPEMMLFLNHLRFIQIETPEISHSFERDILSYQEMPEDRYLKEILINVEQAGEIEPNTWNIYGLKGCLQAEPEEVDSENIDDLEPEEQIKYYELAVAWQDEFKESKNMLHSYFKTDVTFAFPGLLHGTFELSANRNELIKGMGYNKHLFGEAAKLIAEAAELIATSDPQPGYSALRLGMVDFNSLSKLIKDANFEPQLRALLKEKTIFPTTSGNFIDWKQPVAYYTTQELSVNLTPTKFPRLLVTADNEKDELFIKSFNPSTYLINAVIADLASRHEKIALPVYARIVQILHDLANNQTLTNSVFFDNNATVLQINSPIFFPGNEQHSGLPSHIGVQIISTSLATELLRINDTTHNSVVINKLSNFKLKEFNFEEIAAALIRYYTADSNKASVKELSWHLFNLFKNETTSPTVWKGVDIPLLNRKGSIALARELHFGKEYGNMVVDELFSYDTTKLVASPSRFELADTDRWNEFLHWTGVANLPRKVQVKGESDFATYSMRRFNFNEKIDDYHFKGGYTNFKETLTGGYGDIKVTSIADLDKILLNNSPEQILAWLSADRDLLKLMEDDQETNSSSIDLWFYNVRYPRQVTNIRIRNYIKWKISRTSWLTTESGILQCPDKCTTSGHITADFSPLLEKPKIDLDLLHKKQVLREKAEYLLSLTGVHRTVNTLSTYSLYSIFLKLPEIDPEGKKVKSIYNQLALNYDEKLLERLDHSDPMYVQFFKEGKVFCSNGSYHPISQVFYVNDKRLGESVINQFNTIEIDRRRGKDKIRKLFGVQPLENLQLDLLGLPTDHPAGPAFENDLEKLKPYVYAFRQAADGGTEKTLIKEIRFKLVSTLEVLMTKGDVAVNLSFYDFEYLYLKDKRTIYIKTPAYLDEMEKLKPDVHFGSSIAEAFSAMLDVDAQRQQIRELFSRSNNGRDEILRAELDDPRLIKLASAREQLGIANDPKTDFWKSFSKCFRGKKLSINTITDEELLLELLQLFPALSATITDIFNTIDYNNINEESSAEQIVRLLTTANIRVEKFNSFHYPSFQLTAFYELSFHRLKNDWKAAVKQQYFELCLSQKAFRKSFLVKLHQYDSLSPKIRNEIDFDIAADLRNQVQALLGFSPGQELNAPDTTAIYMANKTTLITSLANIPVSPQLVDQYLKEDNQADAMLYFDEEIPQIVNEIVQWVASATGTNGGGTTGAKTKRISFGQKVLFYDDLNELREQIDGLLADYPIENISMESLSTGKVLKNMSNYERKLGFAGALNPKNQKEEIGFLGEYLVYRYLMSTIKQKDTVRWVSKYAKDCNINPDGLDGRGYDLEYVPNGAIYPRYVEVKVAGWENSFHISSTEVQFGEKYKDNYEIFLLRNLSQPDQLRIEKIPGLFNYKGKSFTENDAFTVINDNFVIKFKKS